MSNKKEEGLFVEKQTKLQNQQIMLLFFLYCLI